MITIRELEESLTGWLRSLGFTERESQIISHLISNGPSTVASISKGTGIPRPHVYITLKELASKGLVSKTHSRPTSYSLSGLTSYLRERVSHQLEFSRKMLKFVEAMLPRDSGATRVHEERRSFLESLMRSLEDVRVRFWSVIPYLHVVEGLSIKRILRIRSRGVEVRVATSDANLLRSFLEAPSFVRFIQPPPPFFLAIIDRRALFSPLIEDRLSYGIESGEEAIVKNYERYFSHIWSDDYVVTLNKLRMTTPKEY